MSSLAPTEECTILEGPQGKAVQGLLFLTCCLTLLYKFYRDSGGRSFSEFLMDSSKQLAGSGWIHVLNLVFAAQLEEQFDTLGGDQCDWYWINIVVDTTVGVFVNYSLLKAFTFIIKMLCPAEASSCESGQYRKANGEMDYVAYLKQLGIWLGVVSIMKACMVQLMIVSAVTMLGLAQAVLAPFQDPTMKLLVVMIFTPFCMNSFQFWVTDNFIRRKGDGGNGEDDLFERDADGNACRIRHDDDL